MAPANKFSSPIYIFAVLLVAVVYPRLVMLGDYPYMDVSFWAFLTELCHHSLTTGSPLPVFHGLPLESLLLAWVCELPGMPIFWLRLCDLLFACIYGYFFCRLLQIDAGNTVTGLILALIFLCPLNYGQVIDAGYKNQIPFALCFFLGALYFVRSRVSITALGWFLCGICAAMGTFLREPFVFFAFAGFFAIWIGWSWKEAFLFAFGGLCILCILLAVFFILQGGMAGIQDFLAAYELRGELYAQEQSRIAHQFFSGLYKSRITFTGPIILFLASCICVVHVKIRAKLPILTLQELFLLFIAFLPLLEPLTKIGFLYHFSVCLPGMAFLCASNIKTIYDKRQFLPGISKPAIRRICYSLVAVCLFLSIIGLPSPFRFAMTVDMLKNFPPLGWSDKYAGQSNTLLAASEIRKVLPAGGTLSASGFTNFLNVASGAMSPVAGWFDPADIFKLGMLNRSWHAMGEDPARFCNAIRQNPPDVIAVGKAFDEHEKDYAEEIMQAVENTGLYHPAAFVPANKKLNYGWMQYYIYARNL